MPTALAVVSGLLAALTVISPEWIEAILGVDPDGGNGIAEWAVVGICGLVAVTCSLLARVEWRRRQAAGAAGRA